MRMCVCVGACVCVQCTGVFVDGCACAWFFTGMCTCSRTQTGSCACMGPLAYVYAQAHVGCVCVQICPGIGTLCICMTMSM